MTENEILAEIRSHQVPREDGCYDWSGIRAGKYPVIYIQGKKVLATRLIVSIKHKSQINSQFVAMHSCDYTLCTNEDHLKPGTQKENIQDSIQKGRFTNVGSHHRNKTHCNNGHEYNITNINRRRGGGRQCKICHNQNKKKYENKLKALRNK